MRIPARPFSPSQEQSSTEMPASSRICHAMSTQRKSAGFVDEIAVLTEGEKLVDDCTNEKLVSEQWTSDK